MLISMLVCTITKRLVFRMISNPIKSLPEMVLFRNLTKFSFLEINYSIYHLKIMDVFCCTEETGYNEAARQRSPVVGSRKI